MGSVTALVNGSGALANTYTYTPWGDTQASTGTVSNPFQFTGTYRDSSAYYLMGARCYHQPTGRFTQLDPLPKNLLDINRYQYAKSSPCNATDPTGLDPVDWIDGILRGTDACLVVGLSTGLGGAVTGAITGAIGGLAVGGVGAGPGAFVGAMGGLAGGVVGGCVTGITLAVMGRWNY